MTPSLDVIRTHGVLMDVGQERLNQDEKFPGQVLPDGTDEANTKLADQARQSNDLDAVTGGLTWTGVLLEEVFEAVAETDRARLRAELIQVAAVAVRWVEQIDREQYA